LPKEQKERDTETVLRMVGLWEHREKRPGQISGGMKQRTSIARAFAVHPRVLLLDEPFAALDALMKPTLHEALVALWSSDGRSETVVMVTHDIDEAIFLSDRIVVMGNGPGAVIKSVVDVRLTRPRDMRALIRSTEYAALKERLLSLLTEAHTATRPT
jgi:ABC-type nitrate/sulfonate/bicarbonate transport system ATPase subunit